MKSLQILFYFLNGPVRKAVSDLAVCFGILTVSSCFLEFHLWEFFEPWVKAMFLQKKKKDIVSFCQLPGASLLSTLLNHILFCLFVFCLKLKGFSDSVTLGDTHASERKAHVWPRFTGFLFETQCQSQDRQGTLPSCFQGTCVRQAPLL